MHLNPIVLHIFCCSNFFHCSAAVKRDSLAITVRPEWTFVRLGRAGMEGLARAGMDISYATAQEDSLANVARAWSTGVPQNLASTELDAARPAPRSTVPAPANGLARCAT